MVPFRNVTLKRKLLAILMVTCTVALVMACVGFVWHERSASRSALKRDLEVTADTVGSLSTAVLKFGDQKVGAEILSNLAHRRQIVAACLYSRTGKVFVKYQRADIQSEFVPPPLYVEPASSEEFMETFRPIVEDDRILGTIYLKSDLVELNARLRQYLNIVLVVLLVSLGVAWLVSFRLQHLVSRPILELAGATRAVSAGKDYSLRVRKRSNDEIGELTDGFNEMLGQIQARDAELEEARQGLERRVQERTRELELEIAERKQAEERLRATANRLKQSNRELQDFAYVASHDLQEPLRKVQAFGDRLKAVCSKVLGAEGRDYLERMQAAAKRMQILIDDLLAFSRVTTSAVPFEPVDLARVAHEVVSDLEVRIQQSGGRVEIGEMPTIDADPVQMRQLFQNLIGNALKFHQEGRPPTVRISGQTTASGFADQPGGNGNNGVCQISVQDNGIGFDEKYVDRIFVLFQRLHGRSAYEGTGIGLAICRKIADRHHGTITAQSTPGQGSTFHVTLPIHQPKPAP
jgi:signal transduction histidine kinase